MNKNKKKLFEMIFFSSVVAILITLQMLELAFISINPVLGFTTLHIPVLIGAMLLGRKYGWALGLSFGLISFFYALANAANPVARLFINPLVSVLPRVLFGIVINEVFNLTKKIISNEKIVIAITLFLSTLIHSVGVIAMILLFGTLTNEVTQSLVELFVMFVTVNLVIEMIAAVIVGLPVLLAVKNVYRDESFYEEGSE